MLDAHKLDILRQVRAEKNVTQVQMATYLGYQGKSARNRMSAWEAGKEVPPLKYREPFIRYLTELLGLWKDREQFDHVWQVLQEQWQWRPITDQEWQDAWAVAARADQGGAGQWDSSSTNVPPQTDISTNNSISVPAAAEFSRTSTLSTPSVSPSRNYGSSSRGTAAVVLPRRSVRLRSWIRAHSRIVSIISVVLLLLMAIAAGYWQRSDMCLETIGFGQPVECALDEAGPRKFTFQAAAGDSILIQLVHISGPLVPQYELLGPQGKGISDRVATPVGKDTCLLDESGTYSIHITPGQGGGSGTYRLYVQRTNDPGHAFPIEPTMFGRPIVGRIERRAEYDTYTFHANAGDSFLTAIAWLDGELRPKYELFGPDGTGVSDRIAVHGVPGQRVEDTNQLKQTGRYTLLVHDVDDTKEGAYQVYIQRLNE